VNALLDVVVDLLARTVVWLASLGAVAGAAASVVWGIWGRGRVRWRTALAGGIVGALLLASLAHRFGLPDPGSIAVWRRPIYPVWSVGGALAGSAATLLPLRRRPEAPAEDQ
jgi:hypothetical protein